VYSPATNVLSLATSSTERMRILPDGKVGLGRIPTTNQLELAGDASKATAGSWLANSDARIKTDIEPVQNALEKIDRVRPVSFRYTDQYRATHPGTAGKVYYNVIAQEFAEVFPDAVKESGETLDGKPILQVDIHPALIHSIAAIRQLHDAVKSRDAELARLKDKNLELERRLTALERMAGGLKVSQAQTGP
jgi:hypothetical protein